jgi:ATP-binding cassette subfamily C protein
LGLLTALAESASAAAVFGLVVALEGVPSPAVATLLGRIPALGAPPSIPTLATLLTGFFVLKNALVLASVSTRNRVVFDSAASAARTLFGRYMNAPYAFHLQQDTWRLVHRLTESVERSYVHALAGAAALLSELLVILAIFVVLAVAAPAVTLAAAFVVLALGIGFVRATRARIERWGKLHHRARARSLRLLDQSLSGILELTVLGRRSFFSERFAELESERARAAEAHQTLEALPRLVVETTFIVGALAVVFLVASNPASRTVALPLLGLFAYAGFRLIPSANRILLYLGEVRYAGPALEDLAAGYRATEPFATVETAALAPPCDFRERIALEDVSFTYPGRTQPALRGVCLSIRRGEYLGVVGPSGAGKTTLVHVLLGLLTPTSGRLRVDGVDLAGRAEGWIRQVGYVPQSIFLLADSLRHNVALALSDDEVDADALERALREAGLDELVGRLAQGIDTPIGEGGVRLSGGERQRVGIARALYRDPDLLVLDEATSSLDPRSEREVRSACRRLRGRRTIVVISHRLRTVGDCDRVCFLREGRVERIGPLTDLLKSSEPFRRMADLDEGSPDRASTPDPPLV